MVRALAGLALVGLALFAVSLTRVGITPARGASSLVAAHVPVAPDSADGAVVSAAPADPGSGVPLAEARSLVRVPRAAGGSGCGQAIPSGLRAGTSTSRVINSGGLRRQYRLHLPPATTNGARLPLLLNFHGRTGDSADMELYTGLVPLSDRESFILVTPDGTGSPSGWSAGATAPNTVDDVKFVNDLLDTVEREFCIDTSRVYATGFSNGAFMASRLACEIPDRISAAAVVGGVSYSGRQCAAAVPMLAFHGTADDVVPIAGGIVRGWSYGGAFDAISRWAANNGCSKNVEADVFSPDGPHPTATRVDYTGCTAATSFVIVDNAQHVWPGSPQLAQPAATEVDATSIIWAFLSTKHIGS